MKKISSFENTNSFLIYKTKVFFKLSKLMTIFNRLWNLAGIMFVLCGVISFVSLQKHLLNALLRLEFIILGIFFILALYSSKVRNELNYIFFFLSLAACEGALGLSLLVSIVRRHGNDYFKGFRRLGC